MAARTIDFSTSYDVTPQLTVNFAALNLTDATYSTRGRFSDQPLDIVDYGTTLYPGLPLQILIGGNLEMGPLTWRPHPF